MIGRRLGRFSTKDMRERLMREFMDILILSLLAHEEACGYMLWSLLSETFGYDPPQPTFYGNLHSLEKLQFIEVSKIEKMKRGGIKSKGRGLKKTMRITDMGKAKLNTLLGSDDPFVKKILLAIGLPD